MKNFILTNSDFKAIATMVDLNVLTDSNLSIMQQCNMIAIDEAAGYLSSRYDIETLFADPIEFDESTEYVAGDRIFVETPGATGENSTYTHYSCILDTPVGATTSITDTTYYVEGDTRDQKLLEVVMTIALFYVHKRLTPNNIPEFRIISYDGNGDDKIMSAIKWLTMIREHSIDPYGWPIIAATADPDLDVYIDGQDPTVGIMYGNDMGDDYFYYNNEYDKNIKGATA